MAGNTMTLNFAGDATKLQAAAKKAAEATESTGRAAQDAGDAYNRSAQEAGRFEQRMGSLGAGISGVTDALGSLGSGAQALADAQDFSRASAVKLERAQNDVAQAYQDSDQAAADLRQSVRDLAQAQQDSTQAALDVDQAQLDYQKSMNETNKLEKEYNKAVREHGNSSQEAKDADLELTQAVLDQEQALADVEQAKLDAKQAEEDKTQATLDGKQAVIDAKDAQLNLNDAMKEANPSGLQQWADKLNILTPILSAVVGVMGLVTAAQWAWNAAQLASPTTWIILAIVGLIAVIVLIATKTTWFQDLWKATWNGIKTAAKAVGDWFTNTLAPAFGRAWQWIKDKAAGVWDWMKALPGKFRDAFAKVNGYISAPFRAAFNTVSDAWNNTVGRLNWTVPSWVPHYGGNTVSAPRLPKFHTGGVVPGSPGQEVPIMALAGERVSRPGQGGGETLQVVVKLDSGVLIEGIARAVRRQGGDVQFVLGGANV